MTLRKKTFLSILMATMFIMVVFGVLAKTVFINSYRELELDEIRSDVSHIVSTINNKEGNLAALTNDWSAWDDTYQFMLDRNQDYLDSNLVNGTFEGLGINIILFLDTEGDIIYQKAYDLEDKQVIAVPEDIKDYLRINPDLVHLNGQTPKNSYLISNNIPVMLSLSPILTSKDTGPSRGTLVFGKFIQGDLYNQIASITDATFLLLPYNPELIPSNSQLIYLDDAQENEFFLHTSNNQEMEIYSLIKDFKGSPVFIIELRKNRSIYQQGLASIRNMIFAIILTSLSAGGIILTMLDRSLLSRLATLIETIGVFRSDPKESLSTELPGNDELSKLSLEINQTLHHLLNAQHQLKQNLEYESFIVDISTKFINLPITQIDKAIRLVLETTGTQIGAEAGQVLIFDNKGHYIPSEIYDWQVEDKYSFKKKIDTQLIKSFSWGRRKFREKANIIFSDFEDLPNSADAEKAFCVANHILSAICIPLKFSDGLSGMIYFETFTHFHTWDEQTTNILEIIANILTNAIDRRQNEKQLQQSQQFQFRLNQITKTSIAKDNCDASMRALSRHLKSLIDSDRAFLVLLKDTRTCDIFESGKRFPNGPDIDATIQYLKKQNQKDILIFDETEKREFKKRPELNWLGESVIIVPLKGKKQHMGWIILADTKTRYYNNLELNICRQAGSQVTLSIIKILSLEESQEISRELRDLRSTISDISSELVLKKLQETILEHAIKLVKGEAGVFYSFNESSRELDFTNSLNMKKSFTPTSVKWGQGVSGRAIQFKKTLFIHNYSNWKFCLPNEYSSEIHSTIATPLFIGERILGCLVIFQYNKALNFTKNDQHLLDIFAQHASISIDNATLFEQMQRMARYDEVTGLLNRRALYETGEYELARANRLDRPIAVAMVDLDNYKEINDNYNHLIGDKVLKEISRLFRENVRNIDIVGRYGGDECVIIMPETDIENACAAIERIRCVLESQAIKVDENQFHITACFGISAYKEKPPSLERIIDEADTAMYAAKEAGRNAIRVFQKL